MDRPAAFGLLQSSPHTSEAVWIAWVARNRDEEKRGRYRDDVILSSLLIAAFTAAALFGGHMLEYEFAVGATLAVGAAFAAFRAINGSRYMSAGVFACLAIVYNPAIPVVPLANASALPALLVSAGIIIAMLLRRRRMA